MQNFLEEFVPFMSASCLPSQVEALEAQGYTDLYILAPDGIYRRKTTGHGLTATIKVPALPRKVLAVGEKAPEVPVIKQDLDGFLPAGKIPMEFFKQIQMFFMEVCRKVNSTVEAHCYIMWNEERGYYIFVPQQEVTGASVSYSKLETPPDPIIVDIHSHGSMGAFFSGTDNNSDKEHVYFSGVIGKVNTNSHEHVFRFNMKEHNVKVELGDIFEDSFQFDVPKEWVANVKQRSYTYTGSMYGQGGTTGRQYPLAPSGTSGTSQTQQVVRRQWADENEYEDWWRNSGAGSYPEGAGFFPTSSELGRTGGSSLGKPQGSSGVVQKLPLAPKEEVKQAAADTTTDILSSDEYDYIRGNFGEAAAEAYNDAIINIAILAADPSNSEVLKTILLALFDQLSEEDKAELQTEGLPSKENLGLSVSEEAVMMLSALAERKETHEELFEAFTQIYDLLPEEFQAKVQNEGL